MDVSIVARGYMRAGVSTGVPTGVNAGVKPA